MSFGPKYQGTIQVLRHHVFDIFRPTHPPTSLMIYSTVNHQKMPFSDPTHPFDDVILEWSLGRIIKIVISSNLQRRPSIFKEFFAWKKNKDFFIQICQAVWAISYSLLHVVSKINQGSCLGCLGVDDAPEYH